MSEGEAEIIPLPSRQPITPEVRRIVKRVVDKTNKQRDDMEKRGIVDNDEERFFRKLDEAVHGSDSDAEK